MLVFAPLEILATCQFFVAVRGALKLRPNPASNADVPWAALRAGPQPAGQLARWAALLALAPVEEFRSEVVD